MTLFITGSMLLSSLTGCEVYKDWKQKEETRLMQTTREATAHHALNSYATTNQDLNDYYKQLEALENGMRVLHQMAESPLQEGQQFARHSSINTMQTAKHVSWSDTKEALSARVVEL
jgi:hypothetical protein